MTMSRPALLRPIRLVVFLLTIFFANSVFSQVQTERYNTRISNHVGGFYEYLPQGYSSGKKFPLIVFVHGIGEIGDGSQWQLPHVLSNGTPNLISNGTFPASFNVNGQSFSFIVITPQFNNWPGADDVSAVIDYAVKHYNVDEKRIYLTGLSMGGGSVWDYATANDAYPKRIAALVPVCGASGANMTKAKVMAKSNLPVWALHNDGDPTVPVSYTIDFINDMNSAPDPIPDPLAKKTIFHNNSHNAWYAAYDPNYRENGMNVYEWMLQFTSDRKNNNNNNGNGNNGNGNGNGNNGNGNGNNGNGNGNGNNGNGNGNGNGSGNSTTPVQPPPIANAGSAQTITQPASTVSLTGTGTSQGGTIASYAWTFVSGPNSYNINTPWLAQTNITYLVPGTYVFRLTVKDNKGTAAASDVTVTVKASAPPVTIPAPVTNNTYTTIPARIKAKDWSGVNDAQTEQTSDADGGYNVDYINTGSWMDYNINAPSAGTYTVNLRIATPASNAQLQVKSGSSVLSTVNLPSTGGFQNWKTISTTVSLVQGKQTIRIYSTAPVWNNWNLNWIEFANGSVSNPTPPPATTGNSIHIEAENYSSMYAVQTENTTDAGGGKDVDNINTGAWMNYSVNAPLAGTYTLSFRVATPANNAQFQLKSNTTNLATVNIPNTGGYQTWKTITTTVTLPQGQQTLSIISTSPQWNTWNINWLEVNPSSIAVTPAPVTSNSIHVEAENYSNIFYAQTENTSDAGGGKDVYNNYAGSWISYSINAPSAGTYKVNFRVACNNSTSQFQVKSANGTTLALVNLPNTGSNQTWQTISANINLSQGQQILTLVSTNSQTWNTFSINWMDFITGGSLSGVTANTSLKSITTGNAFDIFPIPAQDHISLQVTNNYSGNMNVFVIDMNGAVKKQFSVIKANTGSTQTYLSIAELPAGSYIIKVQMDQYSDTKKIVKQ